LTALLYAPVRFFLEFLRLELTDPTNFGLTFAQWGSILAFAVGSVVLARSRQPTPTRPEKPQAQRRNASPKRGSRTKRRRKT
jgi:prolipoprotein diacylglyceryltransferase